MEKLVWTLFWVAAVVTALFPVMAEARRLSGEPQRDTHPRRLIS